MRLPFDEQKITKNVAIRIFSEDTPQEELMWHMDPEDRTIQSIEETDWMIQLDDELPRKLTGEVRIPANVYHRLIKGIGKLRLQVTFYDGV